MTPQDLLLTARQWCLASLLLRSDGDSQITTLAAIMTWTGLLYLHDRTVPDIQATCLPIELSNHHVDQDKL